MFQNRTSARKTILVIFILLSSANVTLSSEATTSNLPEYIVQKSSPMSTFYQQKNTTNVTFDCSEFDNVNGIEGAWKVLTAVFLVLIVFFTIFGNVLIICAVLTFHELQTITNMFVGSLACADLIMGAVVLPVGIPYVVTGKWMLGSLFCDIWISIDILTVTASIETLCAIALDRYFAITRPFTYTTNVTRSRARCIIAVIWITSASIAFIPIQLGWWKKHSVHAKCCYENPECCEFMTNEPFAVVSSCISFYVPLTIMLFSYSIVFKEAIRHASQIDDQTGIFRRASMPGTNRPLWNKQQRRTVFTMGYIMGIFTLCWLPFFIVNLVQVFCDGCVPANVFATLNWLGYSNSFFNPFIYCHNNQFRRAFVRLLTCLPCSEGFERTKRASLSDSFPRYRESARESTLYMLTTFFLSGGSSRKKSRKSTSSNSGILKRDSSINRSPTRSSIRHPRFRLGSDDIEVHNLITSNNNNDADTENDCKRILIFSQTSDVSTFSEESFDESYSPRSELRLNTDSPILQCQTYEKLGASKSSDVALEFPHLYPSRRYSDLGNSRSLEFFSCTRHVNGGRTGIRTGRSKSLFLAPNANDKLQNFVLKSEGPISKIPQVIISHDTEHCDHGHASDVKETDLSCNTNDHSCVYMDSANSVTL